MPDIQQKHFFTLTRLGPKIILPKKCEDWQKSEFATKHKYIYLKTSVGEE